MCIRDSAKTDTVAPLVTNHLPGSRSGFDVNQQQTTSNTDQALRKLVDQAADQVTKQLAEQVTQSAASIPKVPLNAAVNAAATAANEMCIRDRSSRALEFLESRECVMKPVEDQRRVERLGEVMTSKVRFEVPRHASEA